MARFVSVVQKASSPAITSTGPATTNDKPTYITLDNLDEYLGKAKTISKINSDIQSYTSAVQVARNEQNQGFASIRQLLTSRRIGAPRPPDEIASDPRRKSRSRSPPSCLPPRLARTMDMT